MTKLIKISTLLLVVVTIITACKFEEPDLFDKSAAERLTLAKERSMEALLSAPNGWVMDYFPTVDQKGYTFLVKFLPNQSAILAAKNNTTGNVYETDTCAYEMISDNGPVLTFNLVGNNTKVSKVGIFHLFTNPEDDEGVGNQGQGVGYGGDYEFMVINTADEKIALKGKKRGVYIDLYRIPEGKNWEEYFTDLDNMRNFLFDSKVTLQLKKGNETIYQLLNSTTSVFGQLPIGGDIITDLKNRPFITTNYGIRLSQPLEMDSVKKITIQQFNLNAERNKLISAEDENYTIVGPQPGDFIKGDNSIFFATKEQTTGMDALFDLLKSESISGFNANYEIESIGFGKKDGRPALALYTKNRITALFNIPLTVEGNRITIATFDAQNMTNSDMDTNARNFYSRLGSIKQLLTVIQGSYTIETSTPLSLRVIKYTKTDASLTLNVSR